MYFKIRRASRLNNREVHRIRSQQFNILLVHNREYRRHSWLFHSLLIRAALNEVNYWSCWELVNATSIEYVHALRIWVFMANIYNEAASCLVDETTKKDINFYWLRLLIYVYSEFSLTLKFVLFRFRLVLKGWPSAVQPFCFKCDWPTRFTSGQCNRNVLCW